MVDLASPPPLTSEPPDSSEEPPHPARAANATSASSAAKVLRTWKLKTPPRQSDFTEFGVIQHPHRICRDSGNSGEAPPNRGRYLSRSMSATEERRHVTRSRANPGGMDVLKVLGSEVRPFRERKPPWFKVP